MRLEVPSLWAGSPPDEAYGRTAQHAPSREELLGTGATAGRQGVSVSGLVSVFSVAGLLFVFWFNKEAARVHSSMSYIHNFIWNTWRIFHQVLA